MTDISNARLKALFDINYRLNKINNLEELLNEIIHSAISTIGAERGLIILVDDQGESYHTIASHLAEKEITFSKSIVRSTLKSGKTSFSSDINEDASLKNSDSVQELNIVSYICVPLSVSEKLRPIGTIYVDQRAGAMTFSPEDILFLEAFANLAAIAIKNTDILERIISENIRLHGEVETKYEFPGVIGQSKSMQKVYYQIKRIIDDDCTVLLTGESGSGKEVIAKAIHFNGERKSKPFLAINCGAFPETILESELFGSVRGAFTGALDKQGVFQAAEGGTLFLDEIHHTSETMQIRLLRVLQDKEIRRVGSTKTYKVDVRLICATNEDLLKTVQSKRFRQDFYYRINVITINIPPLRDRKEDIPDLADHFLMKFSKTKKKSLKGFDKQSLQALLKYDWAENNVRELANEIERAVIYAQEGGEITLRDLSEKIVCHAPMPTELTGLIIDEKGKMRNYLAFERRYIQHVLSQTGGNKTKAARIMGIPRTTLVSKMKKLGLN